MNSFSASSTITTRRGTIIGNVLAESTRSLDLHLAAIHALDVEGTQPFVDHVGELRRDGRLLHVVATDERVERLRLAAGNCLRRTAVVSGGTFEPDHEPRREKGEV